ncbi:hypothetical protein PBY51_010029 [Eleginops maclovinus]|uniref:Uncharacterized protein n=1 Tax=Eleginops maclovinus TaxID=56733 RepID=A0AAN8AUD2_ELEMC|nr:hypothetical protein PBY51_010029 [Eleginops maclovinus]
MAMVPALLTVPSVCHGSSSLCPPSVSPTLPAVPSTVSMHTLPGILISTKPPPLSPPPYLLYPLYLPCLLILPYQQHTQRTYRAKSKPPRSPYQSCHTRRTYCAGSVVHLHRKHPRWLCRQRACVCQAMEQERLEGLLLREGAERQRGRRGAEMEGDSDSEG